MRNIDIFSRGVSGQAVNLSEKMRGKAWNPSKIEARFVILFYLMAYLAEICRNKSIY